MTVFSGHSVETSSAQLSSRSLKRNAVTADRRPTRFRLN
ncbi:unnamed protein product [Soboliphyme baturini]|uniref:DUF1534 domain-containing protein n=1 Tax=Soboliphyme baturini TaxID=241478 RepID=A0A183JAL2_9BILA|nr:unnamed protein product [Soboliphyme baturini]